MPYTDDDIIDAERFAPCADCAVTTKLYLLFERRENTPDHHYRCWECSKAEQPRRAKAIAALAREDGAEVDVGAEVSEGDENGAYVQAWVWVDFSGTPLDKEGEEVPA